MGYSCDYRKDNGIRCGSPYFIKEVEFRHPEYKELCETCYLCQNHFTTIFGQSVLTVDHYLPLEKEVWLRQKYKLQRDKYKKDLDEVTEKVRVGVGLDFFDMPTWKAINSLKVEHARIDLENLRKKQCRFTAVIEQCTNKLNFRNLYIIRVYPKNPIDYVNLLFCSLNHWEAYKVKIGLKTIKGVLNPKVRKTTPDSLDKYTQEKMEQIEI